MHLHIQEQIFIYSTNVNKHIGIGVYMCVGGWVDKA